MEKHHITPRSRLFNLTKVEVVSGKFAMGKRVARDGLVQPIRAELNFVMGICGRLTPCSTKQPMVYWFGLLVW